MTEQWKAPRIASVEEMRWIITEGEQKGFNRRLNPQGFTFGDPSDIWLLEPILLHEHIALKKQSRPHVRCQIEHDGGIGFVDVAMSTFKRLQIALPDLDLINLKLVGDGLSDSHIATDSLQRLLIHRLVVRKGDKYDVTARGTEYLQLQAVRISAIAESMN